jgi:opacity protein-like surface antigen
MRFTSTALAAVIGAVAFAQPAAAEYDIAYLGLRGSFVMTDSGSTKGSMFFDYDEEYEDDGYGVGIFMGWVVNDNFRFEVEGTYRYANLDTVTMVRDDFFIPPDYLVTDNIAGQVIDVGGDAESGAVMGNVYYDIHAFDGAVLPWIGAGVGGVFVDYQIDAAIPDPLDPLATVVLFDAKDNTWVFGYQFMAGVTFPIDEGVSMSFSYRFFQTEDFTYVDVLGEEFKTDLTHHNFDLAIQFHL